MTKAWIGLVEVEAEPGHDVLDGAKGAYVNVVALADDESGFRNLVRSTMNEYNLKVRGISDLGPTEVRISRGDLVPELHALVERLSSQSPIQFDEFQAYGDEKRRV